MLEGDVGIYFYPNPTINIKEIEAGMVPLIKPGNSLGELGVIYGTNRYPPSYLKTRTATCLAVTKTVCLTFSEQNFKDILESKVKGVKVKRLEIILRVPLLQSWPWEDVAVLTMHVEPKYFCKGMVVYRPGDTQDFIFIVAEGTVEIS